MRRNSQSQMKPSEACNSLIADVDLSTLKEDQGR